VLSLITDIAAARAPRRSSWWSRHVVSGTHREPDRPYDQAAVARMLAGTLLAALPFWVAVGLLLARGFGW